MKPLYAYWIAVVIGFLAILWVYRNHRESFTGTTGTDTTGSGTGTATGTGTNTTPTANTAGAGPTNDQLNNFVYTEDFAAFPQATNARMYLTSFSDKLSSGTGSPYTAADGRWYNFKDGNSAFTLTNASGVPATIKTTSTRDGGVPLLNTVLTGPSSDSFAAATSAIPFELPNFTVAWLMKGFTVSATETQNYTLFEMFAEAPNYVRVWVEPSSDAATVEVKAKIGGTVYTLANSAGTPLAASALSGGGSTALTMAFTYSKCTTADCSDGRVTFYIGKTTVLEATLSANDRGAIQLANSNVRINKAANIGARLYAFAFWDTAFSTGDIAKLDDYWSDELRSVRLTQLVMAAIAAEAAKQAAAAAEALLANEAAKQELETCKAAAASRQAESDLASASNTRRWQVSMEGKADGITAGACTALRLNGYGASAESRPAAATATATTTATTTSAGVVTSGSKPWWYIPYIEAMSGVQASAPDFASVVNATGGSTTVPPKAPDTLANGIYRNAVRQMDVNTSIAENVDSKTPVQDPGKQATGTTDSGSGDSFSEILSNFFKRVFGIN